MSTSAPTPSPRIRETGYLGWGLMIFFAIGIGLMAVTPYLTFNTADFNGATARFQSEPLWRVVALYTHLLGGGLALLVGPFQFLRSFRNRWPRAHRLLGRAYLTLGIGLSGISALLIAPGIRGGLVSSIGISSLAIIWLWTGVMAYRAIRVGHMEEHREWMTRNYALTFAAVMLRLWIIVLMVSQQGSLDTVYGGNRDLLFDEVYRVVMWLSWVPNLLFAEYWINRRRVRLAATARVMSA